MAYTESQVVTGGVYNSSGFSIAITPTGVGNLVAFLVTIAESNALTSPDPPATLPGVTTLNRVVISSGQAWLFWGVVSSTAATTFTLSSSTTQNWYIGVGYEFTGTGTTWVLDVSGVTALSSTSSFSLSLTPTVPGLGMVAWLDSVANPNTAPAVSFTAKDGYAINLAGGFIQRTHLSSHYYAGGAALSNVAIASGTTILTASDSSADFSWTYNGNFMGALFYMTSATPAPTRPRIYSQAVQRAANWMKRESGLWSPESGLIPRAA